MLVMLPDLFADAVRGEKQPQRVLFEVRKVDRRMPPSVFAVVLVEPAQDLAQKFALRGEPGGGPDAEMLLCPKGSEFCSPLP
jgi:hypothetical protein